MIGKNRPAENRILYYAVLRAYDGATGEASYSTLLGPYQTHADAESAATRLKEGSRDGSRVLEPRVETFPPAMELAAS